jgi:hypothetical protein
MLSLSDDEMHTVTEIAAPIPLQLRGAFLRALAVELHGRGDIGAGELHRLAVAVRRRLVPWTSGLTEHAAPSRTR